MASGAKNAMNIGKAFASSIVDTYNPKAGLFARLYSRILTGFYLSQLKGSFIEFSKSEFPTTASTIYTRLKEGVKKNDKNALAALITVPNFDLFKMCIKTHKPLPYTLLPTVDKVQIVHCRLTSEKGNQVEAETFAHITVRIQGAKAEGKPAAQFGIFERRMDNKVPHSWKIAFIEDEEEE